MALVRTIGRLRMRLLFQRRAVDENGARLDGWETLLSLRAGVQYLVGGETVMAQRIQGSSPCIIFVLYARPALAIDNTWRAVDAGDAGVVFNLQDATPVADPVTGPYNWIDILATQQIGQVDDG